jgi:DNA-binding transcriptional LysR family regulator
MIDVELRQLRYFVAVAEELNFTRAAERLQIAQPPLSRQIQGLEKALGVELLRRTQRRVELTDAGKVFLDESRQILEQIETTILKTQRTARGETGQLVIGFEGSFNYDFVSQAIKQFRTQFPEVEVVLQEMASGAQVEALRRNRIELGFLIPPPVTDGLEIEVLLSEPLVVALAVTHPLAESEHLSLAQLSEEAWVTGPRSGNCGLLARILKVCRQAGFVPQIRQEANEISMILSFVATGLGVTLVPASTQQIQSQSIAYRPILTPAPEVELAIAWRTNQASPAFQGFRQTLREIQGIG